MGASFPNTQGGRHRGGMTGLVGGNVKGTGGIDQRDRVIPAGMEIEKAESLFTPTVVGVCIHAGSRIDRYGCTRSPLPMEIISNLVSFQCALVEGEYLTDDREGVD